METTTQKQKIHDSEASEDKISFDEHCDYFYKYLHNVGRLKDHVNAYCICVGDMRESLTAVAEDVMGFVQDDWSNARVLKESFKDQRELWELYELHLKNIIHTIEIHLKHMHEFDGRLFSRHVLKSHIKKLKRKISAKDDFQDSRKRYDEIHNRLKKDFPIIMGSRIELLSRGVRTFYDAKNDIFMQLAEVHDQVIMALESLHTKDIELLLGKEGQTYTKFQFGQWQDAICDLFS